MNLRLKFWRRKKENTSNRGPARLTPAEREAAIHTYMQAHPEVDWETHEILWTYNGPGKKMTVESHWLKPNYEAIAEEIKRLDDLERVLFRTPGEPNDDQVVIKVQWLTRLMEDHGKLLALESHGVSDWDGYAMAILDWERNG